MPQIADTRARVAARVLLASILSAAAACGPENPRPPSGPTPLPSQTVPPVAPGGPQTFVGAGDIAQCTGSPGRSAAEETAALLDRIPGTVFTAGDNAYPHGATENFRDCFEPTWGRHRARTHPTPGNHDYETPGAQPYFRYFGFAAGPPDLGYYSFDLGAWHIVSLNSNLEAGVSLGSQLDWLAGDLASSRAECTLAIVHHPLVSSGPNGDSAFVRPLWRLLFEHRVEVVVSGHEHSYERFARIDPDGRLDPVRGIRQFVAGTGGASLTRFDRIHPASEARASAWGVLMLTLHAANYDWEFVPVAGTSFTDAGSGGCR
jgi:hypothetical protein